ncbi:hypothetical protein M501DRAFT_999576 [Patellaria atrata CBS 101060]|uniref:Mpv17/PMP22 family protein n=1 Tax=Patellaria atrata CBS 101060 TaxID=1346257 RepID=A0A9P4VJC3_9PEZI|nr:hypothetical protein M501DRAFT_999576 [Patellaria atrata CBS 101060]
MIFSLGRQQALRHRSFRPSTAFRTRRYQSTRPHQPSGESNASRPSQDATPKTIPGPAWVWLEPLSTPFRYYSRAQSRRPYVTQLLSTLVIYFLGDLSAQYITRKDENGKMVYSPAQTARALLIGGLASIPGYRWFVWLGNSFNYRSKILSLVTKVGVNQIVFTPIFNSYFFGMQSLLSGASFFEIVERIKHTVPVSWVNSCKLWPAVTAFSFTFVPFEFRSIFAGKR